jgi:hypothetical protein
MHVSSKCTINFAFWFSYGVFLKKIAAHTATFVRLSLTSISFCQLNFSIYSETASVSVCTFFSPLLFLCVCHVECRCCSMFLIMLISSYLLSPILSFKMFSSYHFHPSGSCLSSIFLAVHLIFASPYFLPFPIR